MAFLVGLVLAVSPLLRGSWDLWALTLIVLVVLTGSMGWLGFQIGVGNLPLPYPNRALAWILLMATFLTISTLRSPVRGLVEREWWTWGLALWMLLAMPLVPEERRIWVERAILGSAWVVALLAFYQRWFEGSASPEASLVNPNVFAGYIVMVLPLAAQHRQWLLATLLTSALFWTHSIGAWLGLSVILLAYSYRRGGPLFVTSLFVGTITAVSLLGKLGAASASHRLEWWGAAWEMVRQRPFWGFGPGAFAHVFPAFQAQPDSLSSLYAHQHFLEVAAGCGFPFLVVWSLWIGRRLFESRGWPAWSLLAALLHSMVDYTLSMPSNLWLFSYLLVAGQPEREAWFAVQGRFKIPLLIALTGIGLAAAQQASAPWKAERLLILGTASGGGRDRGRMEALLTEAAETDPDHPGPLDALADLRRRAYLSGEGRGRILEAIGLKERSVELHPYRPFAWQELVRLYRLGGREDLAQEAQERAAAYFRNCQTRVLLCSEL